MKLRNMILVVAAWFLLVLNAPPAAATDWNTSYQFNDPLGVPHGAVTYNNHRSVPFAIGNMTHFGGAASHAAVVFGPQQWNAVATSSWRIWYAGEIAISKTEVVTAGG